MTPRNRENLSGRRPRKRVRKCAGKRPAEPTASTTACQLRAANWKTEVYLFSLAVWKTAAKTMKLSHFCARTSSSALLMDPDRHTVFILRFCPGLPTGVAEVSAPQSAKRACIDTREGCITRDSQQQLKEMISTLCAARVGVRLDAGYQD